MLPRCLSTFKIISLIWWSELSISWQSWLYNILQDLTIQRIMQYWNGSQEIHWSLWLPTEHTCYLTLYILNYFKEICICFHIFCHSCNHKWHRWWHFFLMEDPTYLSRIVNSVAADGLATPGYMIKMLHLVVEILCGCMYSFRFQWWIWWN